MHPYLFFYLFGGVTFIPLTLLVTILVLWIRSPKLDKTQPRPTDIPSPHFLQQEIAKSASCANATLGAYPTSSSSSMRSLSQGQEKGGNKRKKARVGILSKSDHQPIVSSSTCIASESSSVSNATSPPTFAPFKTKDAAIDRRNQGQYEHATDSEAEAENDNDHGGGGGEEDDDDEDEDEGKDDEDDDDDNDIDKDKDKDDDRDNGEDRDNDDNDYDNLKGNSDTSAGTPSLKSIPTRGLDVPTQADPNFNREGYVRMTRVPRLGPAAESISDYMTNMLFQPKNARPKDSYYAVLRYDTLFLYESDQQRDCKFVMQMTLHEVKIFPRNLPDNEVFNKEHPIQIKRKANAPAPSSVPTTGQDEYYIFIHTPVVKEDWFLALLHASKLKKSGMRQIRDKAQFDPEAIQNHIRFLHSNKYHEHTRWFNSFFGRLFLGVYKTKRIEQIFIAKIKRKTLKLKRPSFLGEIKVRSFNIGHSIPYITRTRLIELATNGELTAEFHLDYRGGVRVEIEVDVGLGLMSVKPVKVTIVLAVLVKALSGMMTLKVKAPPTNRFWIGFQEPPEMDIVIEPIVADKAIKLNMVISAIEAKIREAMVEAIVLPNMDDYPFFNSHGTGGIFEGNEEVPTEPIKGGDPEANVLGTTGRGSSTTTSSKRNTRTKRRDSESSFSSEHAPPVLAPSDRKHSWSSSATESDVDPESPSMASTPPPPPPPAVTGPYFSQQSNINNIINSGNMNASSNSISNSNSSSSSNIHNTPTTILNSGSSSTSSSSSTISAVASRFKRFSQMNFSKSSTVDPAVDTAPKLNTKPTVATTIATVTRVPPSAVPRHSNIVSSRSATNSGGSTTNSGGGRSMHSTKLQAVIPKLASLGDLSSSDTQHGPRIFASSLPSNGLSKKSSTGSLRRLASTETPAVVENDGDDDDDASEKDDDDHDEQVLPIGNDPLYQPLKSSRASSSSRKNLQDLSAERKKAEFDTFPKSASGPRRWDSMPSNDGGGNSGTNGSGTNGSSSSSNSNSSKNGKGEKDLMNDDLSTGRGTILNPSTTTTTSSSSSSSHIGIAGILESNNNNNSVRSSASSISQLKGNLTNLYNMDKSRNNKTLIQKGDSMHNGAEQPSEDDKGTLGNIGNTDNVNGHHHHNDNSRVNGMNQQGRKNSLSLGGDSLLNLNLNLKQKGDVLLKKLTNRHHEDDQDGGGGVNENGIRHGDNVSIRGMSSKSLLRRFSVRSAGPGAGAGAGAGGSSSSLVKDKEQQQQEEREGRGGQEENDPCLPMGQPSEGTDPTTTTTTWQVPPTQPTTTTNSESLTPFNTSTMSKSAYLRKPQAALGSAKAWVKRSWEDRRASEDDPLLSGKLRMD